MKRLHLSVFKKSESGQSIVLIALVFVGLLAFIGLTVDVGVLFVSYGNLRRAVDNAAIGAATQMRKDYETEDLQKSAAQLLRLNNVDVSWESVNVETCKTNSSLCPADKRKLVRVTASVPVKFSFLPVIGIYETTITANAIAEAASLDVVLLIDTSESMADHGYAEDGEFYYLNDPVNCNAATTEDVNPGQTDAGTDHPELPSGIEIPGECHPFEEVKTAAAYVFANWVLDKPAEEEEDRIAVVAFSNGWEGPNYVYGKKIPTTGTYVVCPGGADASNNCSNPWMSDYNDAYDLITHLEVYPRPHCVDATGADDPNPEDNNTPGSCSWYRDYDRNGNGTIDSDEHDIYSGYFIPYAAAPNCTTAIDNTESPNCSDGTSHIIDSSTAQTTNIGGALKLGASLLGNPLHMRKDALWVVILLTDGVPNATEVSHASDPEYLQADDQTVIQSIALSLPIGFCPFAYRNSGCRDKDVNSRHPSTNIAAYDADDYAHDMADLVACDPKDPASGCAMAGQGAVLYAIGLGGTVQNQPAGYNGRPGDKLLRYVGAVGDDGNPGTDLCASEPNHDTDYNCGNYYFSSQGQNLNDIFEQIASRVFTRLTK